MALNGVYKIVTRRSFATAEGTEFAEKAARNSALRGGHNGCLRVAAHVGHEPSSLYYQAFEPWMVFEEHQRAVGCSRNLDGRHNGSLDARWRP